MGQYYNPLPPANIQNALLNFQPVDNALQGITDQNNRDRQYGLQQQENSRANEQLGLQKQTTASNLKTQQMAQEAQMAQQSAGIAQAALAEKDPGKRAALMQGLYASHPDWVPNLQAHGMDPNDHAGVANMIVNQARGYRDPLDVQAKQLALQGQQNTLSQFPLQKQLLEAQIRQANAKASFPDDVNAFLASQGGGTSPQGGAQNGQPPNALRPQMPGQQSQLDAGPQGMPGVSIAPQTNRSAPGPVAGQATPQGGAVQPTSQYVPAYMNAEDMALTRIAANPNAPRGLASELNSMPGRLARKAYEVENAKNAANLEDKQRAGLNIQKSLDLIENTVKNADPEDYSAATGPFNTAPYASHLPGIGGMTVPEANAAYLGTDASKKAFDLQNRLHHVTKGLIMDVLASGGKGLNMDDARQKIFESTMADFQKSTNRDESLKILRDARTVLRNGYQLPLDPGETSPAAAANPAANAPSGGGWSYGGVVK